MNLLKGTLISEGAGFIVELECGSRIPVPHKDNVELIHNQPVFLGIRPEDMYISSNGLSASSKLECQVDLVEPLGAEALLHVKIGQQVAVMKSNSRNMTIEAMGESKEVHLDLQYLHLFDRETEQSIY